MDPKTIYSINVISETARVNDNGGRRLLIDRRSCTKLNYFPERRALRFRRSDLDRRKIRVHNCKKGIERRAVFNHKLINPK